MQPRRFCVYNQASESFLSLGVRLERASFARILSRPFQRMDEGSWTQGKGPVYAGFFSIRDVVYLDQAYRVVHVIEAFTGVGFAPRRKDAASILLLPARTILTSQTQPGNQLAICSAKEMGLRLRNMPRSAEAPVGDAEAIPAFVDWLTQETATDRRGASRKRWPRLMACKVSGASLSFHDVRDISATGLYLVTSERWPVGTDVTVTLKSTEETENEFSRPLTLEMRVARHGADGLGLEFLETDAEQVAYFAMHVQ